MASSNGSFHLGSPAFADGDLIPVIHTGEGLNLSPPLQWGGAPAGTGSFALVLDDPDAPPGPWVHWVLFNIPASLQRLPAAAGGSAPSIAWGIRVRSHRRAEPIATGFSCTPSMGHWP